MKIFNSPSKKNVLENASTFFSVLLLCRDCFTTPTFNNFCLLVCGWIMTPGHWAVTACLVVTGISGQIHHSQFHRFFSRAKWNVDDLGKKVCQFIVSHVLSKNVPILLVIDDTLAKKRGVKIFGIGTFIDAVNSTKAWKIFSFGHCWVIASVVVYFPWSNRPWALPFAFRLYRQMKTLKSNEQYKKKTELAKEIINLVRSWIPAGRRINVLVDEAYFNSTTLKSRPTNVHLIGAMRPNAVLTAGIRSTKKYANGRPRVRGERLPGPNEIIKDKGRPWFKAVCNIYRSTEEVVYKYLRAQWYRGAAGHVLGVVIVKTRGGKVPFRVFGSTDSTMSAKEIIEMFSCRWPTEVFFREAKQYLGFASPQSWTRLAVERTAPFVGMIYSLVVVWFHLNVAGTSAELFPVRPWYRTKRYSSFADILGAAQQAVCRSGLFDPACNTNNLHNVNGILPASSYPATPLQSGTLNRHCKPEIGTKKRNIVYGSNTA